MAAQNPTNAVNDTYEDVPEYIITHRPDSEGKMVYKIKWLGCDIEDITWEDEATIKKEWPWLLPNYLKAQNEAADEPTPNNRPSYEEIESYTSQVENWEEAVDCIVYLEKATILGYIVYVNWKNGYKSTHHSSEVYAKCPLKMIQFYEKHLLFADIPVEEEIDIL